jgi:hypothetical protein
VHRSGLSEQAAELMIAVQNIAGNPTTSDYRADLNLVLRCEHEDV